MSGGPGYHGWTHRPASDGGTDPIPLPGGYFEFRMSSATKTIADDTFTEMSAEFDDKYYDTASSAGYTVGLTAGGEPCITPSATAQASGWIIGARLVLDNAPVGSYLIEFGPEYGPPSVVQVDVDSGDLAVGDAITVMSHLIIPGPYFPNGDDEYMLYMQFAQKTGGTLDVLDHDRTENWSSIWGMRVF